jgi:hypothetical protein
MLPREGGASLAIDIDKVEAVLLGDGWHDVVFFEGKRSFEIDAYEFIQKGDEKSFDLRVGGGTVEGVPSTGGTVVRTSQKPSLPNIVPVDSDFGSQRTR